MVAVAASVALEPELLSGALIVWLRVTATGEADNSARGGQHRRPPPGDAATALSRLYAEREPLYAQVASVAVGEAADPRGDLRSSHEALHARRRSGRADTERS